MSISIKLNPEHINKLIELYNDNSLPHTNNYTTFRAKINSSTLTIFKTNNVLIQGSDEQHTYKELCSILNIDFNLPSDKLLDKSLDNQIDILELKSNIGTDEVGTGDFFGSIIVVGCFVPNKDINYLNRLGVKDSKELSDEKILKIAPEIMKKFTYVSYELDNLHYNYCVFKQGYNMNEIKAILHNSVINSLRTKVEKFDNIIIDAFTTRTNYFTYLKNHKNVSKDVILEEKAENKYIAVACASIIARYLFLKSMDKLSESIGYDLPKGAGKQVDTVLLKLITEKGQSILKNICKMNFKNYTKLIK